jgi:hypothetical protein
MGHHTLVCTGRDGKIVLQFYSIPFHFILFYFMLTVFFRLITMVKYWLPIINNYSSIIVWEKNKHTFLRHLIDKTASAAISKIV